MYNQRTRLIWICIIIAFIFIVLGSISFFQKEMDSTAALLFALWFLNMILLVILTYQTIFWYPNCIVLIFILFFVVLLFSTLWMMQFSVNLMYSNMYLIVTIISLLVLLQFIPLHLLPLMILSLILWLILFFIINQ